MSNCIVVVARPPALRQSACALARTIRRVRKAAPSFVSPLSVIQLPLQRDPTMCIPGKHFSITEKEGERETRSREPFFTCLMAPQLDLIIGLPSSVASVLCVFGLISVP